MSPTPMQRHSPAADRNKAPLLAQLQRLLPAHGRLLELAAGTGQHAVHFARHLPGWQWQPTDPEAESRASIAAWAAEAQLPNLLPPQPLDLLTPEQVQALAADGPVDAVFCANMLHIAPWACCPAMMALASSRLTPQGLLITYGPYFVQGEPPAPGNLAFDADLRARNPAWGLRWLHAVEAAAAQADLTLRERVAMPANNLLLVFARTA